MGSLGRIGALGAALLVVMATIPPVVGGNISDTFSLALTYGSDLKVFGTIQDPNQ